MSAHPIPAATTAPLSSDPGDANSQAEMSWHSLPRLAFGNGTAILSAIQSAKPFIVTDLAADWPALESWAPERLAERYGQHPVPVYDASFGTPGGNYMGSVDTMPFAEFLKETQTNGRDLRMFLYNLAQQIPEMVDDIHLPALGLDFSRRFVFSFFGCRGSTTPLHFDIDMGHVFHTVIRGQRRIRLFEPGNAPALYQHPYTVRSYVDLDAPDFERFPALRHARGYEVVLEPGETLYMPPGWWHEFYYLDPGIGVSLRATPTRWSDRLRGVANLLFKMPIDRVANRIAPERWFAWKTHRASRTADRYARKQGATTEGAAPR
ncbi:MAG: cupin-like domain-containing protein [Pseudomonadota bacterium]